MASTSWSASLKVRRSSSVWRALSAEVALLVSFLSEPLLWLLVLVMGLCGILAYREPYRFVLDIGGSPKECYAEGVFDAPYLSGFNPDSEFDGPSEDCGARRSAYKWAFEQASIYIPGVGHALFNVTLQLKMGQPSGMPVTSALDVNGVPTLSLPIDPQTRTYYFLVPPYASSDLELDFHTPGYQPAGDPRSLAFAADRLNITALGTTVPAWLQVGVLSSIAGIVFLLLRRWSLPALGSVAVVAGMVVTLTLLLIWQRQGLTVFSLRAVLLLLTAYGLSVLLEPLSVGLARIVGFIAEKRETRLIAGLVVVAWLVRVLGLFHPQTFSSDVGLHINNLIGVTRGDIIFTEGLPADAGGGEAPYPPAQYIMLAPLQLLALAPRTLVTAANALIDSLTILWLWLVLRGLGLSMGTAFGAGTLYVFATPMLRSLSTGEMANVWGQALVMPWLLVLLLWRQRRVTGWLLGLMTAIVLLSHSGVFLSLVLLLAMLGLLMLVRRDVRVWRFAVSTGAALALVVCVYYLSFIDVIRDRPASAPAASGSITRLGFEIGELVRLTGQIGLLLTLSGFAGLLLMWQRCRLLAEVLLAWWLATLLSWGTLLISQQALRWEAFLLPAIALSGGLLIGELWRRRGAFRWGAVSLLGAVLVHGGLLWVQRLITYR